MVTSISNVGFSPASTNSSCISTRFAPMDEEQQHILFRPSWRQKEEAKKVEEKIENMDEGSRIVVSDPNNHRPDGFSTEYAKNDKLIITKVGEDKYQVVVTDARPGANYIVEPKKKVYVVSGDQLDQYLEKGKPMSKKNPVLYSLA